MVKGQFLHNLHAELRTLNMKFVKAVCEACGWSEATYYRKMRSSHKVISIAEQDKIIDIAHNQLVESRKKMKPLP